MVRRRLIQKKWRERCMEHSRPFHLGRWSPPYSDQPKRWSAYPTWRSLWTSRNSWWHPQTWSSSRQKRLGCTTSRSWHKCTRNVRFCRSARSRICFLMDRSFEACSSWFFLRKKRRWWRLSILGLVKLKLPLHFVILPCVNFVLDLKLIVISRM